MGGGKAYMWGERDMAFRGVGHSQGSLEQRDKVGVTGQLTRGQKNSLVQSWR